MTLPALPPQNDTNWYAHYAALDAATRRDPNTARPATIALLGDSITEACGGAPAIFPRAVASMGANVELQPVTGYWAWADAYLGARYKLVYNGGVSGESSTQILARVGAVTALSPRPTFCVVHAGINDIMNDVAASTTTASLAAIYTALIDAGITPVMTALLPVADSFMTTGRWASWQAVNKWIAGAAQTYPALYCNWANAYMDPADGQPLAGMTIEGLHPAGSGAQRIGKLLADTLAAASPTPAIPRGLTSNRDAGNLFSNGMLTGTAGSKPTGATGSLATGMGVNWPGGGTGAVTLSKVARTDEVPGEWQQVNVTTASDNLQVYVDGGITTGYAAGDVLTASCDIQTDANFTSTTLLQFEVRCYTAGYASQIYRSATMDLYNNNQSLLQRAWSGVLRVPDFTVPANTAILFMQLVMNGTGTFRTARWQLTKAY